MSSVSYGTKVNIGKVKSTQIARLILNTHMGKTCSSHFSLIINEFSDTLVASFQAKVQNPFIDEQDPKSTDKEKHGEHDAH